MDILQFYAYSADKNAGEGTGDVVKDKLIYTELNKIPNWRRMFSSKWSGNPFKYKDLTYLTYDHAYQAAKYNLNGYKDIAYSFAIESNSDISKNVDASGRLVKFNKEQCEKWDSQRSQIKDELYKAKFTIMSWPGRALILTKDAILINAGPRIKKLECTRLMKIRKEIS